MTQKQHLHVCFGVSGPARASYLMERLGEDLFQRADAHRVAERFADAIKADGWIFKVDPGKSQYINAAAIWADTNGAWLTACDFSVFAVLPGEFVVDGSGGQRTRGAALALRALDRRPEEIMNMAVDAAIADDLSCGGETFVKKLG